MTLRGARALPLIALVGSLVVLALPAAATPSTNRGTATLSSLESGVLQQLNKIRVQHGLVPLKLSGRLTAASAQHSREMGADGYFEHASHDGTVFWKRIGRWYGQHGFHYWSVGENLLWSSPGVDPAAALQLWMNSPEHRANILTARWREIGVSAVHLAAAPGAYKGLEVTIITTDFGFRH
jgi:Uncharacterized protein with SCP/PR1 domains